MDDLLIYLRTTLISKISINDFFRQHSVKKRNIAANNHEYNPLRFYLRDQKNFPLCNRLPSLTLRLIIFWSIHFLLLEINSSFVTREVYLTKYDILSSDSAELEFLSLGVLWPCKPLSYFGWIFLRISTNVGLFTYRLY